MSPIAAVIICIAIATIMHRLHRWYNPRRITRSNGSKLPLGSTGWPFLGETLQFFSPTSSSDIHPFIKTRISKYGPVFRTNLVGRPMIVSTDPDLNYYVFQQEGNLFESWYPETFNEILGRENIGSLHGFLHKYLKNMVLGLFGPESLKKMVLEVDEAVSRELYHWSIASDSTIEIKDAIAGMIFNLTSRKLISHDPTKSSENLRANFAAFTKGLISFPLDIPGTAYHACLQGRKKAMRMLKNMLQERTMMARKERIDFFDYVIEELSKEGTILTEAIALDLMFSLLFASYETTSMALTMAIKFLTDYPLVLRQLTEEHEGIVRQRENKDSGVTWKEYKSMRFTFQFINETLRLANIAPGIFRKALQEVNFKGYTIPAGWGVMISPPAVHLNPSRYENPLEFNPWRWEGTEVNVATRNFMAFGGGMRFCVGADFAKLQMAIFLHCLVTKYRWKVIKGGDITRNPGLQFPNGFHIQLYKKKII
ncbi:hypothetical protein Dimus_035005 [Dionaea muscipula]